MDMQEFYDALVPIHNLNVHKQVVFNKLPDTFIKEYPKVIDALRFLSQNINEAEAKTLADVLEEILALLQDGELEEAQAVSDEEQPWEMARELLEHIASEYFLYWDSVSNHFYDYRIDTDDDHQWNYMDMAGEDILQFYE